MLCLNGGSSSLKLAVFDAEAAERGADVGPCRLRAAVEGVGAGPGRLRVRRGEGADAAAEEHEGRFASADAALEAALGAVGAEVLAGVAAVGHRIVHGGPGFDRPRPLDDDLLAALRTAAARAPLHLPAALALVEAARRRLPHAVPVACFDGAFHAALPDEAVRLPVPEALHEAGVRRIGYHGLSFASVVAQLGSALPPRTVIAHLGSGASLVALRDGRPVDTTMGLTPAGGVVMATRSGDLDPGVLVHLLRLRGWDAGGLEAFVNRECGILGVAGGHDGVRGVLARRREDPRADLAARVFARSVRKAVGALAAVLGGLDLLVFTGGVGERAGALRGEICEGLEHLGVDPEEARRGPPPDAGAPVPGRGCATRVVATDEERVMAGQVAGLRAVSRAG